MCRLAPEVILELESFGLPCSASPSDLPRDSVVARLGSDRRMVKDITGRCWIEQGRNWTLIDKLRLILSYIGGTCFGQGPAPSPILLAQFG